jgi:hypothetical protein
MNTRGYTVLGWIVWQLGSRLAKWKMGQNRLKLGAAHAPAATSNTPPGFEEASRSLLARREPGGMPRR